MTLADFDRWVRGLMAFGETESIDASLNGIQVGDEGKAVAKAAFAVDACMDSFRRAADGGADVLFVHHGLFWGPARPLTGVLGERVRFLMANGLALYACHLPLDRHAELGNNARMAAALGLEDVEPFGEYRGRMIGTKGRLPEPLDMDGVVKRLFGAWDTRVNALPFGPREIRTVGMVSGGGTREAAQAAAQGLDLYITGDSAHTIYHESREAGLNVLFAGHYWTEVFGVKAVSEAAAENLALDTFFIDVPTGY